MLKNNFKIKNIPAILWGEKSDRIYIYVHGKMSSKESAEAFAKIACQRGYQVLSFDLPEHGERTDMDYKCNIWNGIADLQTIGSYAQENWHEIALFGCSLGAFFSLHAYQDFPIRKCLFLSPILNMEHLIQKMFQWFSVTEEQLQEKGEIPTPVDTLSWAYCCYVKEHPIEKWTPPTCILYGSEDQLQSRADMEEFAQKYNCRLRVSVGSDHPFLSPKEGEIVSEWLSEKI